jgi:hypothetical protein
MDAPSITQIHVDPIQPLTFRLCELPPHSAFPPILKIGMSNHLAATQWDLPVRSAAAQLDDMLPEMVIYRGDGPAVFQSEETRDQHHSAGEKQDGEARAGKEGTLMSPRGLVLDRSGGGRWGRGGMRAMGLLSCLDRVRVRALPTASGGHGAERVGGVRHPLGRGNTVLRALNRLPCLRMMNGKRRCSVMGVGWSVDSGMIREMTFPHLVPHLPHSTTASEVAFDASDRDVPAQPCKVPQVYQISRLRRRAC